MIVEFKKDSTEVYKLHDMNGNLYGNLSTVQRENVFKQVEPACKKCSVYDCSGLKSITMSGQMVDNDGDLVTVDDCYASEKVVQVEG